MTFKSPLGTVFPGLRGGVGSALGALPLYYQKVLGFGPIAYWPLWEAAGTVAEDKAVDLRAPNPGSLDGTYTGVTLGQPGIGDGNTCPLSDGTNNRVNVYSAALNGAFSAATGTLVVWARVFNVGVWTNGNTDIIVHIGADGVNNFIRIDKALANNRLQFIYKAGGTTETVTMNAISTTDWMHLGITWDTGADEMKAYFNGLQEGVTQLGLGVWVGALAANLCAILAQTGTGALSFPGYGAHTALWNRALTQPEIADLATV